MKTCIRYYINARDCPNLFTDFIDGGIIGNVNIKNELNRYQEKVYLDILDKIYLRNNILAYKIKVYISLDKPTITGYVLSCLNCIQIEDENNDLLDGRFNISK